MITLQRKLDDKAIKKIHEGSLEMIEKVGMDVHNQEALDLLKKEGVHVSGSRAFIPGALVEKCLETAPAEFNIYNREGEPALKLGQGQTHFGPGSDLPFFIDPETGKGRRATLDDVASVAKLCDRLHNLDFLMSMALPSDVNPSLTDVYSVATMMMNSKKPFVTTTLSPLSTKAIADLATAIRGSKKELAEKPYYLIYTQPSSPLKHSAESIQSLMFCADNKIPVTYASGAIAGGTAPVTMAGCLAMCNAETLTGLVIHQLKNPGAPFVFGLIASTMDMRTSISAYGGIELPLMHFAAAQLAKYYKLPVFSTGGCSDGNSFDVQIGVDATLSVVSALLSGADLVHDAGYMGGGLVGSLKPLVLVDEIVSGAKRFMQGFAVSDETLAVDTVASVGPGGHFLQTEHTLKHFKTETWIPEYYDRLPYQVWLEQGKPTTTSRIQEKIKDVLAGNAASKISQEKQKQLQDIICSYEKTSC